MSRIRVEPWALRHAAAAGGDQTERWRRHAADLADAIEAFLAGTTEHRPPLPDLPGDLVGLATHVAELDDQLARVAAAFEDLDGRLTFGRVHVTTDLELASLVEPPRLPPQELEMIQARVTEALGLADPLARADAVATLMAGLSEHQQLALALQAPTLVGGIDGMPPHLRYVANRTLVQRELTRAEAELAARGDEAGDRLSGRIDNLRTLLTPVALTDPTSDQAEWHARQVLLFDPSGDGRAVEVFGDLGTATHVGTFVPGITNRLDNFSNTSRNAERLYTRSRRFAGARVATIAWLGYDTPEFVDAPSRITADTWAPALAEFQAALPASLGVRTARTTVIGHSYGSLLTGVAIREEGLTADAFAVIGSPGMNVAHASQLGLPDGVTLYAGRAHDDPVALSESHGTDPAKPWFGAVAFDTGDITGHSAYTAENTTSLTNLASIITGNTDQVSRDGLDWQDIPRQAIPVIGPVVGATSSAYGTVDDIVIAARDIGGTVVDLVADAQDAARGAVSWTDHQLDRAWRHGGRLVGEVSETVTTTLDHVGRVFRP